MLKKLRVWLLTVIPVSALCLLVYTAVQQNYRMSANDPQIQMAEDLAAKLSSGQKAASLVSSEKIDISKSLAVFTIIFDENGKTLASNALLDGVSPEIPSGVLDYTKSYGEDRFTWQPKVGVRSAVVVKSSNNGFILVGRSLREVEIREDNLLLTTGAAWAGTVFASLLFVVILL